MHPIVAKVNADSSSKPGDGPVPGQSIQAVVVVDVQIPRKHKPRYKGPAIKSLNQFISFCEQNGHLLHEAHYQTMGNVKKSII